MKRPPPKQRHRERPTRRDFPRAEQPTTTEDPAGYNAPGHQGGQFDQHEHGDGHGAFGFTQWVIP